MPKQKRPFVVEIEAKLTVHAFDEDSARKKVEKAFAAAEGSASMSTLAECGPTSSCRSRTRRTADRRPERVSDVPRRLPIASLDTITSCRCVAGSRR